MQILIEIPEEKYNTIKNKMYCGIYDAEVYESIVNGTPLPKGHGRLIDEKVAYKKFYVRCLAGVATEVFNETPTIIPADKESEI